MNRQSRFDAGYRMLGAGALGWPRGMVWGRRWEGGSGWGTCVHSWQIPVAVDAWQNQCNILNCGVGEDSWESLGLQGDPTEGESILKEINPGISLEGMMLKLKLQYFGHLMRRVDSLEKTLMLGSQRWRSSIQSTKTRPGADCGSDHELLITKFKLKLKKTGKTARQFRYDL